MSDKAEPSAEALAMQRAMPITRLLDCGMDYADAIALHEATSAGACWDEAAEALADAQLERAGAALAGDHRVTALETQGSALAALIFAQMAFNADVPRKRELYRRLIAEAHALTRIEGSGLEHVEIDFKGRSLAGWLQRPPSATAPGTVILFGGQSGWGLAYLPAARALAQRGLATLMAEGPGQGESRIENGIFLDVDVTAAYQRFVDHVDEDETLGAPGIWGNSVGGLWAANCAAADSRIKACCVNGSFATPRLLPFRTFVEQAAAMLGTDDQAAIVRNFDRLRFDASRERIGCALLVLHGGADPLVSLDDQQPFLDAALPGRAMLRTWSDGEHTIYNHSAERTAFVADWFAEHLSPDGGRGRS